jgi:chromosome segregation ATPase
MPFGLAIVNKEDYHHLIRENNAMRERLDEIDSKVNGQVLALQHSITEKTLAIERMTFAEGLARSHESAMQKTIMDLEAADKQTRQALETLRSQYDEQVEQSRSTIAELHEALVERDAELQRSVDQATSLGYDNELLRKTTEDLATELEVVKRSENEKWIEANAAQAEVIRLKAEIEVLKAKPSRTRRK